MPISSRPGRRSGAGPAADSWGGGGRSPDAPEWSPAGARVDYWLGKDAGSVTLEILDSMGAVVRAYRSGGRGPTTTQTQEMRAPVQRTSGAPTLATSRGTHRFVWDLAVDVEGAQGRMPRAVPGAYQARLTVDGRSVTRPLRLQLDPRLVADGVTVAHLQAQYDLALEILAAMADTRETIVRVEQAIQRAPRGAGVRAELEGIQRALVTDRSVSSYPQPMLADQFSYLYNNMVGADQEPSGEMVKRLEVLKAELEAHKAHLERILRIVAEEEGGAG